MDRFLPYRSAIGFDYEDYTYMLTGDSKVEENHGSSLSTLYYRMRVAGALNINRSRTLSFRDKAPKPVTSEFAQLLGLRRIPQKPEMQLDLPGLVDDFSLNLLDWGSSNILAIALGNSVYLRDTSDGTVSELVTVDEENGPVTSVSWALDGCHIAVGLNNSEIQLWDSASHRQLCTLRSSHSSRVSSMSWNNNILSTGGLDARITNVDFRVRSNVIQTYRGHSKEICGLKWSPSGKQLSSGGKDNVVHIWDLSMSSSAQWLHRLREHTSAVKALAWCPFQSNLLASGGGKGDGTIKFWDTQSARCLNSLDAGSEISSLLWNKNERELLSSCGSENQLTLLKYPSMVKIAELPGHTSRVLCMAQSPDGCTVASAAADERLLFWNVFGVPQAPKPAPKVNPEPFSQFNHIR